ncbi:MAG: hypothetical protein K2X53_04050 [Alphaproteobacteria bacterium]|nr:hypothetical protein [Alphaproteobacteria bacterium]
MKKHRSPTSKQDALAIKKNWAMLVALVFLAIVFYGLTLIRFKHTLG